MKQKLRILFIGFIFTMGAYAQYGTPIDLIQCNNEVFNLTVNNALVLNGEDPATHLIQYFENYGDAATNTNPIANPAQYVAPQMLVIYGRVDHDGQFTIFDFSVEWGMFQELPPMAPVFACDAYVLPPLPANAHYYTAPDGGGVEVTPNMTITATTLLYVRAGSGNCATQTDFIITIMNTPVVQELPNVTVCGSYTLPPLAIGNYYTGPNGTGSMLAAGTSVNATTTVYVYATNEFQGIPLCTDESSFTVTVIAGPQLGVFITPEATTICMGAMVMLFANANNDPSLTYSWLENGQVVPGATENFFMAMPMSTSVYQCIVTNGTCSATSPPATISVDPMPMLSLAVSGDTCVGGNFILSVENPDPNSDYSWTAPVGGSSPVASAPTSYAIDNATLEDGGIYTCTAMNACGMVVLTNFQIIIGTCNNNTISGYVRVDADNNGCTDADSGMPNVPIVKTMGNTIVYTYTDAEGKYSFSNVPEGVHYTMIQNNSVQGYTIEAPAAPSTHVFNVEGTENNLTGDFCLEPMQLVKDVAVYFYATSGARPGFPATYIMVVHNVGGLPFSGNAFVHYNPAMLDFAGASPANVSLTPFATYNELGFTVSNLQPFGYSYFYLNFTVKVPPIVNAGDILQFTAIANVEGDTNLANNEASISQIVVNSYDPNDIAVHQGATIYESQVGNYLDYTIRFQNTGTADAINVRITNELDALLDWSTFTPVYSSHGYRAERMGNMVTFSFDNINLPAESVDEAGSNGFVAYKIKPKATVSLGDIMRAKANIYFDFNLPIVTNEVETEVVELMGVPETAFSNLSMYPNPASGKVTIGFSSAAEGVTAVVYDIQGKAILEGKSVGGNIELNVASIRTGMYFVKLTSGTESVVRKLMVK